MNAPKYIFSTIIFTVVGICSLKAAEISWGSPFTISRVEQILIPPESTLHLAVDFNESHTFGPEGGSIRGIQFIQTRVDVPSLFQSNMLGFGTRSQSSGFLTNHGVGAVSGADFGFDFFSGTTGDLDFDSLLNSHAWRDDGEPAEFSIQGLSIGSSYVVQLFGVADSRSGTRNNGQRIDGQESNSPLLIRGENHSIVGSFLADSSSQSITMYPNDPGDDPGSTGILVFRINENPATCLTRIFMDEFIVIFNGHLMESSNLIDWVPVETNPSCRYIFSAGKTKTLFQANN